MQNYLQKTMSKLYRAYVMYNSYSDKFSKNPNIHMYVDCSGSLSEIDYQDAVTACIKLAQKMHVRLYFTSFSHVISKTTELHVKNHTTQEIYTEFKNTPTVGGGTDFDLVYDYISKKDTRQKQFAVIISDMEWAPEDNMTYHPDNVYYIPTDTCNEKLMNQNLKTLNENMQTIVGVNLQTKIIA